MRTVDVGKASIPVIGLGTYKLRGDTARDVVEAALAEGYRHIDTAQAYGNEEAVGRGIARSDVAREDVFLVTKIWPDDFARDDFLAAVDRSLSRLGTDYIDLLFLHWPSKSVPVEETLQAMEEAVNAGKVRHAGVSNFTRALFKEAAAATGLHIVADQVEHHPFLDQEPLRRFLVEREAALIGYSPLAQGRVPDSGALQKIAAEHDASAAQIALAWALSKPNVAVIPKSASREHLTANLAAAAVELSDEEIAAIDDLARPDGRFVDPAGVAPDWD